MGFGQCNAPATFSRAMDLILRKLNWDIVLAFLDDVVVLGSSFDDHLDNLSKVLQRFRDFHLKLKPRKCDLFQREVQAVREWSAPKTTKEVERFLGFVNYHRIFIKDLACMAAPLYKLTGKNAFQFPLNSRNCSRNSKLRSRRLSIGSPRPLYSRCRTGGIILSSTQMRRMRLSAQNSCRSRKGRKGLSLTAA